MKSKTLTLAMVAAVTAAGALTAPIVANAQSRGYRYEDSDRYYRDACRDTRHDRRVAGGVLGAIAGGVIGSNVDHHGGNTDGTLLGAAAGAAIGSNIGAHTANCDNRGAYWSYNNTYGYDRSYYYRGRYNDSWYDRHRCRWARDWRGDYVRVCPDGRGRYRISY
jgi:uncharacterized protein YcfJ